MLEQVNRLEKYVAGFGTVELTTLNSGSCPQSKQRQLVPGNLKLNNEQILNFSERFIAFTKPT
jgi:hypothetical protein